MIVIKRVYGHLFKLQRPRNGTLAPRHGAKCLLFKQSKCVVENLTYNEYWGE